MDQYMTPVQQSDMPQYPQQMQQMQPMQTYSQPQQPQQFQQPIQQQLPMHAMMTPVSATETALNDQSSSISSNKQNAVIPDWLRDALIIAAVAFVLSHPSTRETLSQWLPMIGVDHQSSILGLLVFGLLVGLGSAVAKSVLVQKNT
jgi:hypothetical protein